jgi:hypothetical protein
MSSISRCSPPPPPPDPPTPPPSPHLRDAQQEGDVLHLPLQLLNLWVERRRGPPQRGVDAARHLRAWRREDGGRGRRAERRGGELRRGEDRGGGGAERRLRLMLLRRRLPRRARGGGLRRSGAARRHAGGARALRAPAARRGARRPLPRPWGAHAAAAHAWRRSRRRPARGEAAGRDHAMGGTRAESLGRLPRPPLLCQRPEDPHFAMCYACGARAAAAHVAARRAPPPLGPRPLPRRPLQAPARPGPPAWPRSLSRDASVSHAPAPVCRAPRGRASRPARRGRARGRGSPAAPGCAALRGWGVAAAGSCNSHTEGVWLCACAGCGWWWGERESCISGGGRGWRGGLTCWLFREGVKGRAREAGAKVEGGGGKYKRGRPRAQGRGRGGQGSPHAPGCGFLPAAAAAAAAAAPRTTPPACATAGTPAPPPPAAAAAARAAGAAAGAPPPPRAATAAAAAAAPPGSIARICSPESVSLSSSALASACSSGSCFLRIERARS